MLGIRDDSFLRQLGERTDDVSTRRRKDCDVIFLAADSHEQLERLKSLRGSIVPNGAIWVVSKKGKQATVRDVEVIQAALDAGLVDNKVVSFSDTHTALRCVIRLRDRR